MLRVRHGRRVTLDWTESQLFRRGKLAHYGIAAIAAITALVIPKALDPLLSNNAAVMGLHHF